MKRTNNLKKTLALLLALVMSLSLCITAMAVDGTWSSVTVGGIRPDRKFCVNADKLSSRKEEQLRGFFGLDTGRLNSAYPPVFRGEKRYARAA